VSSMLHEDEERTLQARIKKFQNRVEAWWIRVDESKTLTLAWSTSFVRGIARLTGHCFDRVFTTRLFSMRIVGISFLLSIASLFLTGLFITTFMHSIPTPSSKLSTVANFLRFGVLALWPAISESPSMPWKPWFPRILRLVWWIVVVGIVLAIVSFLLFMLHHPQNGKNWFSPFSTFLIVIFAVGEICDLSVIVVTRWTLRRISATKTVGEILLFVSLLFLFLLAILAVPVVIGLATVNYAAYVGIAFLFSIVLNSIDVVVVSMALVVGILWLILHLVWPVLQRPLYAIQRIEIEDKERWREWKKLLLGLGVALLCGAIPGVPSWVKDLFNR
jgi:hypothetical protein